MSVDVFEEFVKFEPIRTDYLDESGIAVEDFTQYVRGDFQHVVGEVYENSSDEEDFIFELWYIVSQMTIYSIEIGEVPRYAIETLTRGGGDCEDTAILLADLLVSSRYTQDWDIHLIDIDLDNPADMQNVNHVIVGVDIGKSDGFTDYFIETTVKDRNSAFNSYDYIDGYWFPVKGHTQFLITS